jgi:mono/diheme cytochrome c family protein
MLGCRSLVLADVLTACAGVAAVTVLVLAAPACAVERATGTGANTGAKSETKTPAQAGAEFYALRCSPCHGDELNNPGGPAFDLRKLRPDEHDRFVDSVTAGKDTMPSWYGLLTTAEIDAIWAYIRATVDR